MRQRKIAMRRIRASLALSGALALAGLQPAFSQEVTGHHHHEDMPAGIAIPGDSIYQLPVTLQTAEGRTLPLADLHGRPLLVTMFYSRCTTVCPVLTAQLQRLVEHLGPDDRQQIRVLMVSFDAVRDTPDVLSAFKAEHHIQESNWIVAHASADDVRALAAALGIRYRELPDHTFNHSALISLADREGIVRARTGELAARDDAFMRAIHEQAAAKPAPR
jgi:protein SCO1/2